MQLIKEPHRGAPYIVKWDLYNDRGGPATRWNPRLQCFTTLERAFDFLEYLESIKLKHLTVKHL